MPIKSFTDETKIYHVTPESCTCLAKAFHPEKRCKHQVALIHELNRAQMFLLLFEKFDIRGAAAQSNRCYYELALGY